MSTDRTGQPNSLHDQCMRFSAQPPNDRPIDKQWDHYARYPKVALIDFARYKETYERHDPYSRHESGIEGRLIVAAAFGGVLLASEAGDPVAEHAKERMLDAVNKLGFTLLNQVASPLGEAYITDAGSALGAYLAASATDDPGYTKWEKRWSRAQEFRARRGQQQTNSSSTQRGHAVTTSSDRVEKQGLEFLQKKYKTTDKLAALALAYTDVAVKTGSLLKYYRERDDPIARQHLEDAVSTCLRLTQRPGIKNTDTIDDIYSELAVQLPMAAEVFLPAATLLHSEGVRIKGYEGGVVRGAVANLARMRGMLGTQTYKPLAPRPAGLRRQGGRSSSATQRTPATSRAQARARVENRERIWPTPYLDILYAGPLEDDIERAVKAYEEKQFSYPWTGLYAALAFRSDTWPQNRSPKEAAFWKNQRDALSELVAKQLTDYNIIEAIATKPERVRPDHLAAAIELRPWLTQLALGEGAKSRAITPQNATRVLQHLDQSLDTHLKREYGITQEDLGTPGLRDTLLRLTVMDKSDMWRKPKINRYSLVTLLSMAQLTMARNHLARESLPDKAQRQYKFLWGPRNRKDIAEIQLVTLYGEPTFVF